MTVCYLEVDDEITSAIARMRAIKDGEAIIVVPSGSRIASSRINFKLLAREANEKRLNVVAVSDEPGVRALAISAGLPAYDSIAGAEQALSNFREQDRRLAERIGRAADELPARDAPSDAVARPAAAATRMLPSPVVEAKPVEGRRPTDTQVMLLDQAGAESEARRVARGRARRRLPLAPLLVLGFLTLLVGGVAYGAYLFLPTASITLRPTTTALTLPAINVTADPDVAVVDPEAGVVPAETVAIALHVSGTFAATGVQATETRATGGVTFRSENTVEEVAIPSGTVVATADGIQFSTTRGATVPRADFATSTPGTVDVAVRAARPGSRGNVAKGAITELPPALATQLVSVRNAEATSGGERVEQAVISQDDYDAALAALTSQLPANLATLLANPTTVPRGLTPFSETASIGAAQPDQVALELVGTMAPNFTLGLDAAGQVLAVNEGLIDEIAVTLLRAELPADQQIVGDEISVSRDPGVVAGNTISYIAVPTAMVYRAPDNAGLIDRVRGKTVLEARAILTQYGSVEITLWPEFIDRLPEQSARISLTVAPPAASQ